MVLLLCRACLHCWLALALPSELHLHHHQRGLYCPPLIPAGIRRNPVNSRNSIGINFGTVACQVDKTILAECGTEWFWESHGRNGPRMRGMESTMPKSSIGKCRHSIWVSSTHQFLLPQPPPPSSTTPTHRRILAIVTSLPPSHHHHLHRWLPPTTSIAQDQHSKDDVATPRHQPNERRTHQ